MRIQCQGSRGRFPLFFDHPDVPVAHRIPVVLEEDGAGLVVVREDGAAGGAGEFEVLVDDEAVVTVAFLRFSPPLNFAAVNSTS